MSAENVEITREAIAALNRGDVDAFAAVTDPAVEFQSYLSGLATGGDVYRGHDGLKQYFRDFAETWEDFRMDPDEFNDNGDKVLVHGQLKAKGKKSGVAVDAQLYWVCTFREGTGLGRTTRVQVFPDLPGALEASGLSV